MRDSSNGNGNFASTLAAALVVFLVALALHGLVLLQYRNDPFSTLYVSDALSYDQWAARLARNGIRAEPVFHQSPLFPILLSAIHVAADPARVLVWSAWLQILLNSAAIALLVPLGRVWFDSRRAGIAAASLALLHGPFVFYGMKLLPLPLALATQALALLALGSARRRPGFVNAVAAGLALGLACIARTELLLFVPLALIALLFPEASTRGSPRTAWRFSLACLLAFAATIAPVTLHNWRQGDRVLIASSAGENLYIGNQAKAQGGYTELAEGVGDVFSQRAAAERLAVEAAGRPLKPSEVSAYWRSRTFEEFAPGRWLALELRKLGRILHPGDPTDIYSFALERERYLTALYLLPLTAWSLILLGVGGALLAWPRRARCWPVGAVVAVQFLLLLSFFVDNRLRLPLLFFLALFGGLAVDRGLAAWREAARRPRVLLFAGLLIACTIAAAWATRYTPRDAVRLAAVLSREDRLLEALEVLDPVIAVGEPDPLALDQAGWVLQKLERLDEARERYLAALRRGLPAAREVGTRSRLAQVHERLGQPIEARAQHDAAVSSERANAGTYYERGMFRYRQQDLDGAIDDLGTALRLDPNWPPPRLALERFGRSRP